MKFPTKLIHHPGAECEHTGAVSTPIYQVSTFRQRGTGASSHYDYSRTDNPTRGALEQFINELEGGAGAAAFGSGMAAISACLTLLDAGDQVVATEGLYGGTYRVLRDYFSALGITSTFVDTTNPEAVEEAIRPETRAVFVETPSNPLMKITDIERLAALAHAGEALLMVDNTFMSPYLQRPLERGADLVIHSATKFLGGHSDVINGLVVASNGGLAKDIRAIQNAMGAIPSPMDCWIVMRGMKTLQVRMDRAQNTAGTIARWLVERAEVKEVLYPGLGTLKGDGVHHDQADGPGAVLSFRLRDELIPSPLMENASVWTPAVSLGGVESIITRPSRMTHLPYSQDERQRLGITDDLIRLSAGLEAPEDLIEELECGLELCHEGAR